MDQNPLEQQRAKIEALREQYKSHIVHIFDNPKEFDINHFVSKLDSFQSVGVKINREEIIKGIEQGLKIKDRGVFSAHILKVLEPIIVLQATQQNTFSKISREDTLSEKDNVKLSEVLYVTKEELSDETEIICIHLPPATDFMTKDKIGSFKTEIQNGLVELAKILQSYPNKKEICASSWITATTRGRKRLEDLGFTYIGMVSEEHNDSDYYDNQGRKKPFANAIMKREDFLARYGSSK